MCQQTCTCLRTPEMVTLSINGIPPADWAPYLGRGAPHVAKKCPWGLLPPRGLVAMGGVGMRGLPAGVSLCCIRLFVVRKEGVGVLDPSAGSCSVQLLF